MLVFGENTFLENMLSKRSSPVLGDVVSIASHVTARLKWSERELIPERAAQLPWSSNTARLTFVIPTTTLCRLPLFNLQRSFPLCNSSGYCPSCCVLSGHFETLRTKSNTRWLRQLSQSKKFSSVRQTSIFVTIC